MIAWLKRCVFNLDLNRESVSQLQILSGRLFKSLGAKYEKVLPPLVNFAILGTVEPYREINNKNTLQDQSSPYKKLRSFLSTAANHKTND